MEELKNDIEQVKVQILTGIKLGRVEQEWGNMIIETCNRALTVHSVRNRPCFGVVEMAVHDFFTSHNSIQEITDQEGESYTMEFLESHKEWLGISDDC